MCLPGRALPRSRARRLTLLPAMPRGVPTGLEAPQEKPDRASRNTGAVASHGDGFDVVANMLGDLTMSMIPAVGSRVGILWRSQRLLAKVVNTGDPPGIFFVEFFIGRRRAILGCHVDDSTTCGGPWWWQPTTGDEQGHYIYKRVRHAGHGRPALPRLPLFDGLPPKPRPARKRRTAEQIAQSRARAVATRARNRTAARRAEAAAEIAATAARQAERQRWKAEHPAPTRQELETLRGMFPAVHKKGGRR